MTSPFAATSDTSERTGSSAYANDTRSNSSARSNVAVAMRAAIQARFRRAVEHLEDPLGRGQRLLRRRRHLRELLERLQHPHHEDEERDQRRAGHRAGVHHSRADPENRDGDRRADGLGDRLREHRETRHAHHAACVTAAALAEARFLVRLAAERLHEPDAAHRLLNDGRHLAVLVAQASVALAELAQQRLQQRR